VDAIGHSGLDSASPRANVLYQPMMANPATWNPMWSPTLHFYEWWSDTMKGQDESNNRMHQAMEDAKVHPQHLRAP
jgi:hypothetical protein